MPYGPPSPGDDGDEGATECHPARHFGRHERPWTELDRIRARREMEKDYAESGYRPSLARELAYEAQRYAEALWPLDPDGTR